MGSRNFTPNSSRILIPKILPFHAALGEKKVFFLYSDILWMACSLLTVTSESTLPSLTEAVNGGRYSPGSSTLFKKVWPFSQKTNWVIMKILEIVYLNYSESSLIQQVENRPTLPIKFKKTNYHCQNLSKCWHKKKIISLIISLQVYRLF